MTGTLAGTLLSGLEDWFQKVESTEKDKSQDRGQNAMNGIAVGSLFTQITLIVQCLGTDPDGWKEVEGFIQAQSGRYKANAVHGCLNVLNTIAKLFTPKG
jgi:hypothetical protein